LEKAGNAPLFKKTGLLDFGPPEDPDLEMYMEVLRDRERPVEWLDNETIVSRFPMLSYSEGWGAAWDPSGGLLVAHRCLNAVQSQFLALGGRIITGQVKTLDPEVKSGVQLEVNANSTGEIETLSFDRAVGCGFSGSGFKHSPATGRMLAALALEQDETIPSGFRADRYTLERLLNDDR
jgi:glycine/D-amino acid oxidase-like deaminating enzyme